MYRKRQRRKEKDRDRKEKCGCRWEGFEWREDSFGRGPAWGMMPRI
jgi:hypothetical protein